MQYLESWLERHRRLLFGIKHYNNSKYYMQVSIERILRIDVVPLCLRSKIMNLRYQIGVGKQIFEEPLV